MNNNTYYSKRKLQERLGDALRKHRIALGKTQLAIALEIGKSEKTCQRWESTGKGLTDIFDILHLFEVLKIPTGEIVTLLGLPPLSQKDVEILYQDEAIQNEIKSSGIYRYLRDHCAELDDITIEKLVDVITEERLKRRRYK